MENKKQLTVSVIQTELIWENVDANLQQFTQLLNNAAPADIYVLPEMFTTGFSMQPEKFASESHTKGLAWLKQTAANKNAAIIGSLMVDDEGKYFNRLFFVTPQQQVYTYDKKHLFSLGNEQNHYTAGTQLLLVDYLGWKICPLVCYDLRFPAWARNSHNYDLLIYVANWPERRAYHWRNLLVARAIENQTYVAACNRIGADGSGVTHNGNSMLIDCSGQVIAESINASSVLTHTFSKEAQQQYRASFPFLADRDRFTF
jgi:omega-amidase